MNRIVINELDTTTNVSSGNINDVVYIPGFSVASLDAGTTSAKPRVPTLCTTLEQFYEYFGRDIPTFITEQAYPAAFSDAARPESNIMFKAKDYDLSYAYAVQLLVQGLPVVYERVNMISDVDNPSYDVTVNAMYSYLSGTCFATDGNLADKGLQIKYLTTGGYPSFEYDMPVGDEAVSPGSIAEYMVNLCASRGDCVALIDHTNNAARPLTGVNSVFGVLNAKGHFAATADKDTYAAMFTPWANYSVKQIYDMPVMQFPGSFAYLTSLAKSIKTNSNWLAIAGVARGKVSNITSLNTEDKLTNAIADGYQFSDAESMYGISLNAITYINGYGYCIWGNRTLRQSSQSRVGTATGYLNLRNMVSDIKKLAFTSAQRLLFEQNTDILWLTFKSYMTPLLSQLVSGGGLSAYKIVKNQSNDKTKLSATIRIYPVYAVDSFEISVVLSDTEVSASE